LANRGHSIRLFLWWRPIEVFDEQVSCCSLDEELVGDGNIAGNICSIKLTTLNRAEIGHMDTRERNLFFSSVFGHFLDMLVRNKSDRIGVMP
jgi:hypothetical protein